MARPSSHGMLHEIVEENIEREAGRLRDALDRGHILPEDF